MNQEEFVLSQRIASGAFSSQEALQYAAGLAEALRRKHQAGAVGEGLDPDHIVWNGTAVEVVQNGAGGLTPYASPEQLRGEVLDARSDIFAFGAVLYELLSGRKAFAAHGPEELKLEILEKEPAPLEGISDEMALVLGRCLEKRKEKRWQRMGSILIELKLANAKSRQAQPSAEWKDRIASLEAQIAGLEAQIAGLEARLTAHQGAQEAAAGELRQSTRALEDTTGKHAALLANAAEASEALRDSVAGLEETAQGHTRSIESIEAAIAQTVEVVERVVDAVGSMHRAALERGEAKADPVPHNGN